MFRKSSSRESVPRVDSGEIVKQGYLKKMKTMRKKYFVLRGDSNEAKASLDYYESEKKWRTPTCEPKRSIPLKNCFNINKCTDTRHKYAIALYTRTYKFGIVFDTEDEMEAWLKAILELQQGKVEENGQVRPNFEHVWEVFLHEKELGSKTNMVGNCRLCLNEESVLLVRVEKNETAPESPYLEIAFRNIRRCGPTETFFYMEVGQWTAIGAGNLWFQAEDSNIAANIHQTIMGYLQASGKNSNRDSQPRARAVSVNESSRPAAMTRWSTHSATSGTGGGGNHQRTYSFPLSPLPPARRASTGTRPLSKLTISTSPQPSLTGRDRSDSMPTRSRTTSESAPHFPHPPRHHSNLHGRPHSTYNRGISHSPPNASSPVSPGSATDSAGSSISISDGDVLDGHWEERFSHSPDEPVIVEETDSNMDDYAPWIGEDEQLNNYVRNNDTSLYAPLPNTTSGHLSTSNLPTPNNDYKRNYSPSQVSRLETNSPGGASRDGSYMIMSPGSNTAKNHHKATVNHSRGSSLTDDGYVPMAPGNSYDGYVDMDHGSARHRDLYQSGELSTGSSCSMTSGTPSTDQRFSDYPLDKVISYLNADEEAAPAEKRRTFSLGSRPACNKNRTEMPVTSMNERPRAFSLGTKNVKVFNNLKKHNNHHQVASSHSSVEPSDDMMELDFTKKGRAKSRKKPSSSERLSVPGGSASTLSSAASSYSTAEGSYMEMSPRCSPSLAPSPPKSNRLLAILGKSPPKHDLFPFTRNSPPVSSGYPSPSLGRVPEMEPLGCNDNTSTNDSYMDMRPKALETNPKTVAAINSKARIESFPSTVSHVPRKISRDDSSLKRKMSHTCTIPEDNNNSKVIIGNTPPKQNDYVNMDLGSKSSQKNNSNEDYMEMDGRGDKTRSQPIAIQSNVKETSHNSLFSLGRKHSTGTSPKRSFLQFGSSPSPLSSPYGTLGRSRSRKNNTRRDSHGNLGSTSSGSSSSIFPMSLNSSVNSPDEYEPKCPVDATSGTVLLTDTSRSVDDLTSKVECFAVEDNPDEYVMYEPGAPIPEQPDYAEMAPVKPSPIRKTSAPLLSIKKFDRFLTGLGVGQLTSSTSSPSIRTTCPEPSSEPLESPSLPEEEEEEEDKKEEGSATTARAREGALPPQSPPQASESRELHYASLDLARSGSESEESNKTLKTQSSLTESSSASSPSPNPADGSSFSYAEIDFAKSGSSQNQ